jgi:hypothetical protein
LRSAELNEGLIPVLLGGTWHASHCSQPHRGQLRDRILVDGLKLDRSNYPLLRIDRGLTQTREVHPVDDRGAINYQLRQVDDRFSRFHRIPNVALANYKSTFSAVKNNAHLKKETPVRTEFGGAHDRGALACDLIEGKTLKGTHLKLTTFRLTGYLDHFPLDLE